MQDRSSYIIYIPEAATGDVLYKKLFLKVFQNYQENICSSASFLSSSASFLKLRA